MKNNKKNLDKFSAIMWAAAEEFGGKISTEGMKAKFRALKEYSIEEIQAAGNWIIRYRKEKFPPVPTVQEFIEVLENKGVSLRSKAIAQAENVIHAIEHYNPNITVVFKDPITAHIMKIKLRSLAEDSEKINKTWIKKEFIEEYEAYSEGGGIPEHKFINAPEKLHQLANGTIKQIKETP